MKNLYNQFINAEPARLMSTLAAIAIILVNVAAYFSPQLDGEAALIITGAIGAIAAVLAGEGTRKSVTPWNGDNPLVKYPEDQTPY
jgi:peptidoglycan/LPS O-acetylase OafA/YrhL